MMINYVLYSNHQSLDYIQVILNGFDCISNECSSRPLPGISHFYWSRKKNLSVISYRCLLRTRLFEYVMWQQFLGNENGKCNTFDILSLSIWWVKAFGSIIRLFDPFYLLNQYSSSFFFSFEIEMPNGMSLIILHCPFSFPN